jgi:hypothetical protein
MWTAEEDALLQDAVRQIGPRKWKQIAEYVPNRDHVQCVQVKVFLQYESN